MITCRSDRRPTAALLLMLGVWLTACAETEEGAGLGFLGGGGALSSGAASRMEAPLAGGALRLEGPAGWCIEPRSMRNTEGGSFALLAGCRELTQQDRFDTAPRGYATVVVGPFQPDPVSGIDVLREALGPEAGTPRTEDNGLALAQMSARPEGSDDPVWRGALVEAGWPVMIAVYSADGVLAGDRGAQLVRDIAAGLRPEGQGTVLEAAR